jgi:hypothetical protein
MNLGFHLKIRAGGFDFGFLYINSTALQSVICVNGFPTKYIINFSHAKTTAKASFSIC